MATVTNVRVMVPRVRRALENAGAPVDISDEEMKDRVADALADVILYTGSAFGKDLAVLAVDDDNVPQEYATSDALTLPEQSVVASQAALNYLVSLLIGLKVSETISDEAQTWTYDLSANIMRDAFAALKDSRDRALDAINESHTFDVYESFLAVRDVQTVALIEPWVARRSAGDAGVGGGIERDWRFG